MVAKSFEHLVDDLVSKGLDNDKRYESTVYPQNYLPPELQTALAGASKNLKGKGAGKPDFSVMFNSHKNLVIIIEDKYELKFLEKTSKKGKLEETEKAIKDYALNGAVHYAKAILNHDSEKFKEVLAVGVAGEKVNDDMVTEVKALYFYDKDSEPKVVNIPSVDMLFSNLKEDNFEDFYESIKLTDDEREAILATSYESLKKSAKDLNRLFYDYSFPVDQRVVVVSGFMLAMEAGLTPDDLKSGPAGSNISDGAKIYNHIQGALELREMEESKRNMMLSIFAYIKNDIEHDKPRTDKVFATGSRKGQVMPTDSINKEVFTFIYDNVWKVIDKKSHIDSLGEMYSEFLKYALGDGKENGVVLTPPYVTQMMCKLIDVDRDSRVFDPCTGSAGFLVSAMSAMLNDMKANLPSDEWEEKEQEIKKHQLMGVELDLKMFSLAVTNMILRGDGSSRIMKASAFDVRDKLTDFAPTKALLNPPFSYSENGMPFVLESLNGMAPGGDLAVIIQDSAGTGKSIATNKKILDKHTLVGSIRMAGDLFQPSAGVQTSIYVFKAHIKHDEQKSVRFVDFSEDGYKRTGRGLRTIGDADTLYKDVVNVFKYGSNAKVTSDIEFVDDTINISGANAGKDWNFTQHQVFDTVATEEDFMKTVSDYMNFELGMILSGRGSLIGYEEEETDNVESEVGNDFVGEEL